MNLPYGPLGDQDSMLPIPGASVDLDWKMFSFNHWSRLVNVDNTEQVSLGDCSEARGDGGRQRSRG